MDPDDVAELREFGNAAVNHEHKESYDKVAVPAQHEKCFASHFFEKAEISTTISTTKDVFEVRRENEWCFFALYAKLLLEVAEKMAEVNVEEFS